ncbi:hypothetical protein ABZX85_01025 [Streptomyces sp. NPDC004539]|uniref:hypothetical protein n=1 Tax=Streptomyces sp. NPDC004539 TaxID=3154280 RepID=UPI0033B8EEB2
MPDVLGFYAELDPGIALNGSLHTAVRPTGEPDEPALVAYLDAGHILIDVMESAPDVLTGLPHRHSPGCSSPVTDGTWFWRLDLPHYVETHHVVLPEEFLAHVRSLGHRMPALVGERFAPVHDANMPVIGWSSAVPWPLPHVVIQPVPRPVDTKAQFDAGLLERSRVRPRGSWSRARKPRWSEPPDSIG